jgi:hypothetical protein
MSDSESKICPVCKGSGVTQIGDNSWKQCICAVAIDFKRRFGAELTYAERTKDKLRLYSGPKVPGGPPILDLTKTNLLIKGHWEHITPHIREAFIHRAQEFSFTPQIVTDEKLRTVYVGAEAYTSRSRKRREEVVTYNSLSDLVGADYHLLIIRLGFLGYSNKAMPGILMESLMVRESIRLPTWIIDNPDRPFEPGHYAYSFEVDGYIARRFQVLDLVRERTVAQKIAVEEAAAEPGISVEVEPTPAPKKKPSTNQAEEGMADDARITGGSSKGKKGYKPYGKKKPGGSGPIGEGML